MGQIASGVIGGIGSVYQAVQGAKERREAQDALNHYKRQELTNVADGLQVSTLGSDLQRNEQSRLASSQISALQDGGTRSLIGGLSRVEAGNQRVMQQTGADLDMQQKQIDQMRAEDEARIRSMQENREQNDINALSSQLQSGKQDMYSGIGSGIQAVGMLGGAFGRMNGAKPNDGSQFSTSGYAPDTTNTTVQNPISNRFNYDVNNTQQQPINTYGNFFSRNPYTPSQNMGYPSWYNDVNNKFANVNKIY